VKPQGLSYDCDPQAKPQGERKEEFMLRLLVLASIAFVATGCTTYSSLSPAGGGDVEYQSGMPVVVSRKDASVVQVMPAQQFFEGNSRIRVWVNVANRSGEPVDFDVGNVTANDAKRSVGVYTYEQIAREIKRQAMWAAIAQGMQAAGQSMQAANAGHSTSYSSGTVQARNSYGTTAYGTYQGSTTTYNYAAAQAAQAQVDANNRTRMAEIAATQESQLASAERIVRRTTVRGGESYTGLLVLDAPTGEPRALSLRIGVGSDVHEIRFNYVAQ
jgi:hypothetical protein